MKLFSQFEQAAWTIRTIIDPERSLPNAQARGYSTIAREREAASGVPFWRRLVAIAEERRRAEDARNMPRIARRVSPPS